MVDMCACLLLPPCSYVLIGHGRCLTCSFNETANSVVGFILILLYRILCVICFLILFRYCQSVSLCTLSQLYQIAFRLCLIHYMLNTIKLLLRSKLMLLVKLPKYSKPWHIGCNQKRFTVCHAQINEFI